MKHRPAGDRQSSKSRDCRRPVPDHRAGDGQVSAATAEPALADVQVGEAKRLVGRDVERCICDFQVSPRSVIGAVKVMPLLEFAKVVPATS